jgi:alpha-1,3-rhamnosyl/mannosyltransferase
MACGTPVACFDNSSLPEVAGEAAILAPDGDTAAMAGAVNHLLDDVREREFRVATGRAWAANFTWARCAEQTLDVYRTLEEHAVPSRVHR